jgi:hypothetical protein
VLVLPLSVLGVLFARLADTPAPSAWVASCAGVKVPVGGGVGVLCPVLGVSPLPDRVAGWCGKCDWG